MMERKFLLTVDSRARVIVENGMNLTARTDVIVEFFWNASLRRIVAEIVQSVLYHLVQLPTVSLLLPECSRASLVMSLILNVSHDIPRCRRTVFVHEIQHISTARITEDCVISSVGKPSGARSVMYGVLFALRSQFRTEPWANVF